MDDNLAWTTQVGQAFLNQQQDVMNAIQALRVRAQSLGNLPSTPQETVQNEDGEIDIVPTDPDQMYLPSYDPNEIYYTPGFYCTFGVGWSIGFWMVHDWDWRRHRLITWGPGHWRPDGWWRWNPGRRFEEMGRARATVWRSGAHFGALAWRPEDRGWGEGAWQHRGEIPRPTSRAPNEFHARSAFGSAARFSEAGGGFGSRLSSGERPESRVGMFGGPGSSFEARQASSRGRQSRGFSSFSSGRGGGGFHGGGGFRGGRR
jgi:hypothetical protein